MSAVAIEGILAGLAPYGKYRESDAGSIGRVPDHWELARLKAHLVRNDGGAWGSEDPQPGSIDTLVLRSTEQTIAGGWRIKDPARRSVTPGERHATLLCAGDLLVTKSSGSAAHIGKTTLVTPEIEGMECGFSNFMQRLRTDKTTSPTFLWYFLNSSPGREQMVHLSSTTTGLGNLTSTILGNLRVAFPPPDEQVPIVRFLDHADRRIQRAIRAKKRLIALLNEQKAAIIHDAVTRGLDPTVPLRPSGVGWLGAVPAHWGVVRNGRLFSQRNETGFPDLSVLEVSLRTGVRVRDLSDTTRKQVMSEFAKYKRARKGDLAYNMMRMWQGAVGVAPGDGLVSPAYVIARPLPGTCPAYFSYLFRTQTYMTEVDKYSRGIVKDRNRLYWEDFKQIPSPFPPYDEQVRIVQAIDDMTARLSNVATTADSEISLLQEFRTRLIADIVTGKLDARAAAANLLDEIEEEEPDIENNLDMEEMGEEADLLAEEVAI